MQMKSCFAKLHRPLLRELLAPRLQRAEGSSPVKGRLFSCFALGKPAQGGWQTTPLCSCRVSLASLVTVGWLVSCTEFWICLEEKLPCHTTGRGLTITVPRRLCWAGQIHSPVNDDKNVPVLPLSRCFSHRKWLLLCPLRKFIFA